MDNVGSPGTSTVTIKMIRETGQGVEVFSHAGIPLVGGDAAQLRFGSWTSTNEAIPLVTSDNGRQSTEMLSDEATG